MTADHSTPRKIGKDGNSLKVTLDRELLAELDLERGDRLVQSIEDGRLVMQQAEWQVSD
jgi:antitoxin component of MazEF toxin-antitoxin module